MQYPTPSTYDKHIKILYTLVKRICGITMIHRSTVQYFSKETVSYDNVCAVMNKWRLKGWDCGIKKEVEPEKY
jgi:hypothetical protein